MAFRNYTLSLTTYDVGCLKMVLKQTANDRPPGAVHADIARRYLEMIELFEEAYDYGASTTKVQPYSPPQEGLG